MAKLKILALCYNKTSEICISLRKTTIAQPLSNRILKDIIRAVFTFKIIFLCGIFEFGFALFMAHMCKWYAK